MDELRARYISVMEQELEYLYEILDGSESKAEKLLVQKQAERIYKQLMTEKEKVAFAD